MKYINEKSYDALVKRGLNCEITRREIRAYEEGGRRGRRGRRRGWIIRSPWLCFYINE